MFLEFRQEGGERFAALTCLAGGEKRSEELGAVAQFLDADAQFVALLITDFPQVLVEFADSLETARKPGRRKIPGRSLAGRLPSCLAG